MPVPSPFLPPTQQPPPPLSTTTTTTTTTHLQVEFVEKPRQLLVLGGMMAGMAYLGYAHDDPTTEGNTRAAFGAVAAVFLTHCFLQVGCVVVCLVLGD
jgi:hypothetical protein